MLQNRSFMFKFYFLKNFFERKLTLRCFSNLSNLQLNCFQNKLTDRKCLNIRSLDHGSKTIIFNNRRLVFNSNYKRGDEISNRDIKGPHLYSIIHACF